MILLKDSMYKSNTTQALAEMQASYDVQKKENIIIQQKLALVRKNYLLYGSLSLLCLGLILSYILFKSYRRKQIMRLHLMQQEEKLKAQHAIEAAEENERKRIAADLHDSMGAYASAIISNVDEILAHKERVDKTSLHDLKENAAEIMSNLRDTIWALNNEKISLTAMSDRFKRYAQKASQNYPSVNVLVKEEITDDVSLSPIQALNLFRVLQEAITNALKHSQGKLIDVIFRSKGNIRIMVNDNGIGFGNKRLSANGNGITNMESRAKESGFAFGIRMLESGGTEVSLSR